MKVNVHTEKLSIENTQRFLSCYGYHAPVMAMLESDFWLILNRSYDTEQFVVLTPDGKLHEETGADHEFHNSDTERMRCRALLLWVAATYNKDIPATGQLYQHWRGSSGGNLNRATFSHNADIQEWVHVNF